MFAQYERTMKGWRCETGLVRTQIHQVIVLVTCKRIIEIVRTLTRVNVRMMI